MKLTLSQINQLPKNDFIKFFSDVIEHSPWVAEKTYSSRPFQSLEHIHKCMNEIVLSASRDIWKEILSSYPQLSSHTTTLTHFSLQEHKSLGLTELSTEEGEKIKKFNEDYFAKFSFPFVVCVRRLKNIEELFSTMKKRFSSTKEQEINNGIVQVMEIAYIRIESLIKCQD